MDKTTYDFRGKQSNIFRLGKFDVSGLIHTLFYRILIFVAVIYGLLLLASVFYSGLGLLVKIVTIIVWILVTPQLFAAIKAFSLVETHGAVFGKFSNSYTNTISKNYKPEYKIYKALPYAVVAVWIVFFVVMLVWWPI
jgi:hypothetical protein